MTIAAASVALSVRQMLEGSVDMVRVAQAFDAMGQDELVQAVRMLGGKAQQHLWDAAKGFARMALEDLVPRSVPDETQVIHAGKNTMPLFSVFEKRFARPAGIAGELWGYNQQGFMWFSGPGAFTVTELDGELEIDCTRPPPRAIAGWPTPTSNRAPTHFIVYGNLKDRLRKVSQRVCVGSPAKNGKPLGSHFVLARMG